MQALSPVQLAAIVAVSTVLIDALRRFLKHMRKRDGLPLPPGPTQVPILGNLLSISLSEPWKTYTEWNSVYGDIFYLRLLDQDVVVLGSQSIAIELLEKRSNIYSDRPTIATHEPYGIDCIFAFTPYGEHWRWCRRIFHQTFRLDAALTLRPMQLRKVRQLAMNMIDSPDRYVHHYTTFSTAVPLSATYGYEANKQDDPVVSVARDFLDAAIPATIPEHAILFGLFPFLLQVPDWFPASWLKREAKHARDLSERLTEIPYHYIEDRMKADDYDERPIVSMVSNQITCMHNYTDQSDPAEFFFTLKKAAVSGVLAGSDTTISSLMVFTLAMVLHPRVWKCAQAQIDAVVGTNRLPDFGDRPDLPYVDALIREMARWKPVVPLGVWHATTDNDTYNGYFIPKGTTVVANTWAMSRDETCFPNAEEFIPERFLKNDGTLNEKNPMDFVFGFGRRICPGRHVADASLFASISTMLAMFEFRALKDAQGEDLPLHVKWVNGITRHPEPFACCISPRAHVNEVFLERVLAELK